MPRKSNPPAYRHQKSRNLAVVRIHGKDYYLGEYGSAESKQLYAQLIAEKWADLSEQSTARLPLSRKVWPQIDDLIAQFMTKFVVNYYIDRDGKPSERQYHIRLALRPLHELYGSTPIDQFGSKRLKLVRERIIQMGIEEQGGYSRRYVNDHVAIIKNFVRWCVEEELAPADCSNYLAAVQQLRKGRDKRVKENEKVMPIAKEVVKATLPFLAPQLATMVQLQLHTAMRPDEVTIMRLCDIDQSGDIWMFVPQAHKREHHELPRPIFLGPRSQQLMQPWLDRPGQAYLFSPQEVVAASLARRRKSDKNTPAKFNYRNAPRDCYDDETYCRAVKRACKRAGVPTWTPNRLRHTAATYIRETYGLEAAKIILGHQSAVTTEIYAEKDAKIAMNIMKEIG